MDKGENNHARSADGARLSTPTRAGTATSPAKLGPLPCADLDAMDREGLLRLWCRVYGTSAPKGMSPTFLRRFLAFDLQTNSQGALPAPLIAKLNRIEAGQDRAATPVLKAGGRLLREWNGVTHVIDATPEGYLWQGQHHRSLSAIARAITGAHWSGPRFFGLQDAEGAKAGTGKSGAERHKAGAQ